MALIKCPECKKDISDKADNCPNCGYKILESEKEQLKKLAELQKQPKNRWLGYIVIIIIIIVFIKLCNDNSQVPWQDENNSLGAYVMAEKWVKERLVSPSTAEFPNGVDKFVSRGDGQVYFIDSYVDSQNRMGGMMRTYFHAEIEQIEKDRWKLIKLEFKD